MKKIFFAVVLISLLFNAAHQASAQSLSATEPTQSSFDTADLPQWVKDLRRWDIITFGLFPFSLFAVTFTTDMIRWGSADWDRRYAPWPFKAPGGAEMTSYEFGRSILIAAGISMTAAFVDLIIVMVKRNNERRRAESLETGSVTIDRSFPEEEPQESGHTLVYDDNDSKEE